MLTKEAWRLIDYLTFKMDCAREQEALRWKLDVPRTQEAYDNILVLKEEKVEQLADAMPKRILTKVATQPKNMTKKDGGLSSHGEKWVALCKEYKQPVTSQSFVVKTGEERGNPNSSDQVKDWLYSLGWKPRTYKFVRDKKTGEERQIEQVRKDGELCESVKELNSVDPAVDLLDGLTVLTHRAGILKGFLECVSEDGYLQAEIAGLTNTLRFKHAKPLVNLPGVDKPYGDIIRGVLTCDEGDTLCGSDVVSLEDTTRRHFVKPLDPDLVAEQSEDGYDPHLKIAVKAGMLSEDDYDFYTKGDTTSDKDRYGRIHAVRKKAKVVTYSAMYGVGAAKLARETGMSVKEAKTLLDAFWNMNWAVEAVAKSLRVRELFGSMWLYNPVSRFWYSLRTERDKWSTLNQGTGVFCFDTWLAHCSKKGVYGTYQAHDEVVVVCKKDRKDYVEEVLKESMQKTNEKLKLNVTMGIDVKWGNTYADVH